MREKERELARAWERKHGRAPTSRELLHIANAATLQSRKGKEPGAIDWDALARQWDATFGGDLAGIAPAVSDARGPGAQRREHHAGRAPTGPPTREAQARALAKALVLVSAQHPAWTRHDLLKQLALVLPAETRQMSPEEAQELLLGLAEEALSGRSGEVVCLEAPEWPPLPARCAASWTGAASIRGLASRDTPPPRSCPWRSGWSRTRRRKARRGCPASWPRGVSAPTSRSYARNWSAACTTRASTPRRAGCAWTRRPPRGTCSPRPAPWR